MAGHITLAGRSKDTIVLSNGENIEPQPIEDACCSSPYIAHLVIVGQDKRMLGALVWPKEEAFDELEQIKGGLDLCIRQRSQHRGRAASLDSRSVRGADLGCLQGR